MCLAKAEHIHCQQILEHQIRLHELQLAAQRAQHELEFHQKANTALNTVYNEILASKKQEVQTLGDIHQESISIDF